MCPSVKNLEHVHYQPAAFEDAVIFKKKLDDSGRCAGGEDSFGALLRLPKSWEKSKGRS